MQTMQTSTPPLRYFPDILLLGLLVCVCGGGGGLTIAGLGWGVSLKMGFLTQVPNVHVERSGRIFTKTNSFAVLLRDHTKSTK